MIDSLAAEARRLRTVEELSVRQIQDRLGVSKRRLYELLRGVSAPAWTKRPNAKDELRAAAEELRARGRSVNDIALELGVAKSTAYQWVKHLPLDPDSERAKQKRLKGKLMTAARWEAHQKDREHGVAGARTAAGQMVGSLSDRDILLIGAVIYWCEGTKSKPWRRDERLVLINSDPTLLALFLRYLEVVGVYRETLGFRLSIHESADPHAAIEWWVGRLDLPKHRFRPTTLKRHNPKTTRLNTGSDYHGCLIIEVPRSRELYWGLESTMMALAAALDLGRKQGGSAS